MDGQNDLIRQVILTPLRRIHGASGDVFHGLKASSPEFAGFGEAYFSSVLGGAVKGWKKHTRMTLNLIVIKGEIQFTVYDEVANNSIAFNLTPDRDDSYARLTVPPGVWLAFGGVGDGENMLTNIASIEHDPDESITRSIDTFKWTWQKAP